MVRDSSLPGIMGGGMPTKRGSSLLGRYGAAASSATARISGADSASAIIWCPRSEGCVLQVIE